MAPRCVQIIFGQKRETLGKIAKQYYSKPIRNIFIFEANKYSLKNLNATHLSKEVVIPNL
jgi:hypothetical protein